MIDKENVIYNIKLRYSYFIQRTILIELKF